MNAALLIHEREPRAGAFGLDGDIGMVARDRARPPGRGSIATIREAARLSLWPASDDARRARAARRRQILHSFAPAQPVFAPLSVTRWLRGKCAAA
jgi:hypothetical protein